MSAFCSWLNRGQICWKLLNCTGSTAQTMQHSFMLFSQLSAPSAMIGSASFQLITSHYRPSCEHAALWLETNVWALITIWRENEIQGQLNLAVSSVRSGAQEAVYQATSLLSRKASFHPCSLAGGGSPSACRSHGSSLLVLGQEQLVLIRAAPSRATCPASTGSRGCCGANWCGMGTAPAQNSKVP